MTSELAVFMFNNINMQAFMVITVSVLLLKNEKYCFLFRTVSLSFDKRHKKKIILIKKYTFNSKIVQVN